MREVDTSSTILVDWCSFIREGQELWVTINSSTKIGGRNKIVEIDEAKFGRRKYNLGRVKEDTWLFGDTDRETKKLFIERTTEKHLTVSKIKIRTGLFKSYNCLEEEGNIFIIFTIPLFWKNKHPCKTINSWREQFSGVSIAMVKKIIALYSWKPST